MKIKFTQKPCSDAKQWLDTQPDIETAWKRCPRGDWMWWTLMHLDDQYPSKILSVEFANWCAERGKKHSARAAAYAAYAADAADAAADAAYAADAAADAAYAAYAAAHAAERLAQADWIREHIQCPVVEVIA